MTKWEPESLWEARSYVYDAQGQRRAYSSSGLIKLAGEMGNQRQDMIRWLLPPKEWAPSHRPALEQKTKLDVIDFRIRSWRWRDDPTAVYTAEFISEADVARYLEVYPGLAPDWVKP